MFSSPSLFILKGRVDRLKVGIAKFLRENSEGPDWDILNVECNKESCPIFVDAADVTNTAHTII